VQDLLVDLLPLIDFIIAEEEGFAGLYVAKLGRLGEFDDEVGRILEFSNLTPHFLQV